MPPINTNENLRTWFLTCPEVAATADFGSDYLGSNPSEVSIYSMPSPLRYSEDILGDIHYDGRQILRFMFALRAVHGADAQQNLENLQFFDTLKEWMYAQNTAHSLPVISEGEVVSIMPEKTQFLVSATANSAMYQMQCALTYNRK